MDPREAERVNLGKDAKDDVDVRRPEIEPDRREGLEVEKDDDQVANPPHTDSRGFLAPKFGSAGSGGAEYEGGLPKD